MFLTLLTKFSLELSARASISCWEITRASLYQSSKVEETRQAIFIWISPNWISQQYIICSTISNWAEDFHIILIHYWHQQPHAHGFFTSFIVNLGHDQQCILTYSSVACRIHVVNLDSWVAWLVQYEYKHT